MNRRIRINRKLESISSAVIIVFMLASAVVEGRPQQKATQNQSVVQSTNTAGRIAKFTGPKTLGDSNITEDSDGKIGIGTTLPTSQLTVNGIIELMGGLSGIRFPDGTIQTTAGLPTVLHDGTLGGNGSQASPLGLAVPLVLTGALPIGSGGVVAVSNTETHGEGMTVNGGPKGSGLRALGGSSPTIAGAGVIGTGGNSLGLITVTAGTGVIGNGGNGNGGPGGVGLRASGGSSASHSGGTGLVANGGSSNTAGRSGGIAIQAWPGVGTNGATYGLAGEFNGNVEINGFISKAGGSFKIDHPVDPENKYLSHSFVESPDMKNIYDGIVSLDTNGEAVVDMPEWFGALNRDFRYLLTAVGAPMPGLYIAEEMASNRFKISGGMAGMKVSWQVTGVRQDAWATKNRIPVEEQKSEKERGHYLHPEAFGQAEERGIKWATQPDMMREMKQRRLQNDQREPRN